MTATAGSEDTDTARRSLLTGRWIDQWEPEDEAFWQRTGRTDREPEPALLGALRAHRVLRLDPVVGAGAVHGARVRHRRRPGSSSWSRCRRWSGRCSGCPTPSPSRGSAAATGRSSARRCCSIPTILAAFVMHPGTSYTTFMVVACFAGVGGGNFASSMTNINAFFPRAVQGLGARAQRGRRQHRRAGDPAGRAADHRDGRGRPPADPARRLHPADRRRRDLSALLHGQPLVGAQRHRRVRGVDPGDRTPGSWRSSTSGPSARSSATASPSGSCCRTSSAAPRCRPPSITFIGPLLGSLIRPVGGRLADRYGGAKITFVNFVAHGRRRRRSSSSGRPPKSLRDLRGRASSCCSC